MLLLSENLMLSLCYRSYCGLILVASISYLGKLTSTVLCSANAQPAFLILALSCTTSIQMLPSAGPQSHLVQRVPEHHQFAPSIISTIPVLIFNYVWPQGLIA